MKSMLRAMVHLTASRGRTARRRMRLQAQQLENRTTPAITVDTTSDVVNATDGKTSLREAITAAANAAGADTIDFKSSVFSGGPTMSLSLGQLSITDTAALTIDASLNGNMMPVINAGGASRVFDINAAGVTINITGLRLTGGSVTDTGGGIRVQGGNVTLDMCDIAQNQCAGSGNTRQGGGVAVLAGTTVIKRTIIQSNTTQSATNSFGGGLYVAGSATVNVTDSSFLKTNQAAGGNGSGAYVASGGSLSIADSEVSGNLTASRGGGIYCKGALTLARSDIINNDGTGGSGGGIFSRYGSATIDECTIGGNKANVGGSFAGGGVIFWSMSGAVQITNSTFSGNSAGRGGAICFYSMSGTPKLLNCTISGNTAAASGSTNGGGGLFLSKLTSFSPLIYSCTITDNHASGSSAAGGGILQDTGTITLKNCIVAKNTASTAQDLSVQGSGALSATYTLINDDSGYLKGGGTGNQINSTLDPKLRALNPNGDKAATHALAPDSPAVDVGDGSLAKLTAAIGTSNTSISVDTTAMLLVGQLVQIDNEIMTVAGVTNATTATVVRATTPAMHSANAAVSPAYDERGPVFPKTVDYPNVTGAAADIGAYDLQKLPVVMSAYGIVGTDTKSTSRITSILVMFDQAIVIDASPASGAFKLALSSDSSKTVSLNTDYVGETQKVVLTFNAGSLVTNGSLIDGKYDFTILSTHVHVPGNSSAKLDGNKNGTVDSAPVDDNSHTEIKRYFGDGDFDGDVDIEDFSLFRAAFGKNNNDPSWLAEYERFDSDGDGDVDLVDFTAFRSHFGTSLP